MNEALTPEERLAQLDAEIGRLQEQRAQVFQRVMEQWTPIRVGDLIEWKNGLRGRVLLMGQWVNESVWFKVRNIRKDGSEGATSRVFPFDEPRKVER